MSTKNRKRYVKPYDAREKHLPGCNFCGPGTNVARRMQEKVQPMNSLDQACKLHDLDTESRGPQKSKTPKAVRASDRRLERAAKAIALDPKKSKRERALAWVVHRAMLGNKWRQSRRS